MYRIVPNKKIRQRAREICLQNRWRVLAVGGGIYLIFWGLSQLSDFLTGIGQLVFALVSLVISTLMAAGMTSFSYVLWHSRRAGPKDALHGVRRPLTTLGAALPAELLPSLGELLCGVINIVCLYAVPNSLALLVLFIQLPVEIVLMFLTGYYLPYRLSLAIVYLMQHSDASASECLRESWRKSRTHLLDIFCHRFALNIPVYAVALLAFILYKLIPLSALSTALEPIAQAVNLLLHGYISLATVGQAEFILSDRVDCIAPPLSDNEYASDSTN